MFLCGESMAQRCQNRSHNVWEAFYCQQWRRDATGVHTSKLFIQNERKLPSEAVAEENVQLVLEQSIR